MPLNLTTLRQYQDAAVCLNKLYTFLATACFLDTKTLSLCIDSISEEISRTSPEGGEGPVLAAAKAFLLLTRQEEIDHAYRENSGPRLEAVEAEGMDHRPSMDVPF